MSLSNRHTVLPLFRVLILLGVVLGLCGPLAAEPTAPSIHNASQPEEGLMAAGQPTAEQLGALAEAGFRSVIDMRTAAEDRGFDEAAESARLGLAYRSIPIGRELASEQLSEVFDALDQAERPLLVHCASSNRVGALYYAYLVERGGVDMAVASQRATAAGLRSAALRQQVERLLEQRSTTTVILVRHAEKTSPHGDPPLSAAGQQRAAALATLLRDAEVRAIYATQFARTQQTAAPLATVLGVEVTVVAAGDSFAPRMAKLLSQRHGGEVVVSISHSNTVPAILAELGIADPPPIADHQYDGFYMVTLSRAKPARLMTLRYGAPTP